jgi:outer membrane receptor for monomeric catechols
MNWKQKVQNFQRWKYLKTNFLIDNTSHGKRDFTQPQTSPQPHSNSKMTKKVKITPSRILTGIV